MLALRRPRLMILALFLAYTVAIQGVFGGIAPSKAFAAQGGIDTLLCRSLAASDGPSGEHDVDRCKILCASGACSHFVPLDSPVETGGLNLQLIAALRISAHFDVAVAEKPVAPSARGPPRSFV